MIQLIKVNSRKTELIKLRDQFFESGVYVSSMDSLLNGMINQKAQTYDPFITEDVTNNLFANIEFPGSDLIARNIQRGREHGIPRYYCCRQI